MDTYFIISCEARFRERICLPAVRFEELDLALAEAGRAAEGYIQKASMDELAKNEAEMSRLRIRKVYEKNGKVCGVHTLGCVFLY